MQPCIRQDRLHIILSAITIASLGIFYVVWVLLFRRLSRNEQELSKAKSKSSLSGGGSGSFELSASKKGSVASLDAIKEVSSTLGKYESSSTERSILDFYKNHKKVTDIVLGIFLIVGLVAFVLDTIFTVIVLSLTQSTIIARYGSYSSIGTKAAVSIEREPSGVIHILAQNDYDMFFAQGFVSAQERLFQMEVNRRIVRGTLSEVVGSAGLSTDRFSRIMGWHRLVKHDLDGFITDDDKAILQAFVNGINSYIERTPLTKLGPEFNLIFGYVPEQFTIADCLGWSKLISWDLSGNISPETQRYAFLKRGLSLSRVERLYPPMSTFSRNINGTYSPNNIVSILSKSDLGLNETTQAEDFAQEYRLYFNNSAAYIPKTTSTRSNKYSESSSQESFSSLLHIYNTVINSFDSQKQQYLRNPLGVDEFGQPTKQTKEQKELFESLISHKEASNSWTIHKNHTDNGRSILANDPHLTISAPGIWLLFHLQSNETKTDLQGAAFVSVPGIAIGRNSNITWGITVSGPDNQDLYAMKLHSSTQIKSTNVSENSYYYEYDGAALPFTVRTEIIKYKASGNMVDYVLPVFSTHFGPVVNDVFDDLDHIDWTSSSKMIDQGDYYRPFSFRWVALQQNDSTVQGFFKVNKAKNFQEFTEAVKLIRSVSVNYIYADVDNIGIIPSGIHLSTPIRREGHTGLYPVYGHVSTWDYDGYLSGSQVPISLNPSKGYLVACNNRLAPSGYKYSITSDNAVEFRAKRATELLSSMVFNSTSTRITPSMMKTVQLDSKSLLFESLRFVFTTLRARMTASNVDTSSYLWEWNEKLVNWDGFTTYGSQEAALFHLFFGRLTLLPYTEVGRVWVRPEYFIQIMKDDADNACTLAGYLSCIDFAKKALQDTVSFAFSKYGTFPKWNQNIHYISAQHSILSKSPVACFSDRQIRNRVGGAFQTLNVANVRFELSNSSLTNPTLSDLLDLKSTHSVSYRQIIGFTTDSSNPRDFFIIPLGQSGNPLDQHYDALRTLYENGEYLNMQTSGYVVKTVTTLN